MRVMAVSNTPVATKVACSTLILIARRITLKKDSALLLNRMDLLALLDGRMTKTDSQFCKALLSGAIDTNIKYSDDQLFQKYSNWNFANIDASFWNKTQQLKIIDTNI